MKIFGRNIKLAIITNPGTDSGPGLLQQLFWNGKVGKSTLWMPFGFHAIPDEKSYSIILRLNDNDEERIHLGTSMERRPKGKPGEVFMYHPPTGSMVKMSSDGSIEVVSGQSVTINAPETVVTGNLTVDGDADFGGAITDSNGVDHVDHTHDRGTYRDTAGSGANLITGDSGVPQ